MKRILTILAIVVCSCSNPGFPFDTATVHDLESGATLSPRKASKAAGICGEWHTDDQAISFVRLNPEVYGIDVITAEGEDADSTSAICVRYGAIAGINGSYFNMDDLTNTTFIKDDGLEASITFPEEYYRVNGAFLHGVDGFMIEATDTTEVPDGADLFMEAMAAGPILVDDGTAIIYQEGIPGWKKFYNRKHPRSLIGVDDKGFIWLIVADGRFPESQGLTIAELTALSLRLGFTDALNLDGGGSSTLWTRADGVLNHPFDNHRFDHEGQRVVPSILAVWKR